MFPRDDKLDSGEVGHHPLLRWSWYFVGSHCIDVKTSRMIGAKGTIDIETS